MRQTIRTVILSIYSGILLLTGCSPFVENNIIEEIAPVIFWSITEEEGGKLTISTLIPPLVQEDKRLLTMQVDLLKQGEKEFNLIYYRELKIGQLRMVFINEGLAKKGIMSLISTMLTDPDISQRLFIAIVKGNLEDYIKKQLNKQENLDYFLYLMFKHYENQGEMSIVNLYQFKKMLHSPFSNPFLPVFKAREENLSYEGTAFFKSDKLVASFEDIDDQIFQLISNNHYLKLFTIPTLSLSLGQVRSKVNMKLSPDYSSISIKVDLNGIVEEYRGDKNLLEPDNFAALNKEIEAYLEEQTKELLKKMQKWEVTPLQVKPLILHPFKKPISSEEWSKYWEHMEVNVEYSLFLEPLMNVKG